jgi:hypothetical protein
MKLHISRDRIIYANDLVAHRKSELLNLRGVSHDVFADGGRFFRSRGAVFLAGL